MATIPDIGGDASSNLVRTPGQTVTYIVPAAPGQKVTSVLATINNGAASAVSPKVTIRDPSGVVIATNTQEDAIPAGDSGTATFALRLDKGGGGGIRFSRHNEGGYLDIETTGANGILLTVAQNSDLTVKDAAGNTILTAGAGAAGDYGVGLFSGGTGALLADVSFAHIQCQSGTFRVDTAALVDLQADDIQLLASNSVDIESGGAVLTLTTGGTMNAQIQAGQTFTVLDSGGSPIFRVDEDGDLHGLTGKSLTFDL